MTATVLDTGPLYAFFDANDSYHAAAASSSRPSKVPGSYRARF